MVAVSAKFIVALYFVYVGFLIFLSQQPTIETCNIYNTTVDCCPCPTHPNSTNTTNPTNATFPTIPTEDVDSTDSTDTKKPTENEAQIKPNPRPPTMVVYIFSESNPLKRANLDYFVMNGMCEHCTNVDYYIVVNGDTNYQFPTLKNLIVVRKENRCGDFGGFDYVLTHYDYKKYKRFMILNDTVRGPFVDPHYKFLMGDDFHFTDIFAQYLVNNVKIVGSYINCGGVWGGCGTTHVQSMAWMIGDEGLEMVRPRIRCYLDKVESVNEAEIGMSKQMTDAGYNIASLQYAYRGVNFVNNTDYKDKCNNCGDPTYRGNYFGQTISPTEVVFFKNTRDPGLPLVDQYTEWFPEKDSNHFVY